MLLWTRKGWCTVGLAALVMGSSWQRVTVWVWRVERRCHMHPWWLPYPFSGVSMRSAWGRRRTSLRLRWSPYCFCRWHWSISWLSCKSQRTPSTACLVPLRFCWVCSVMSCFEICQCYVVMQLQLCSSLVWLGNFWQQEATDLSCHSWGRFSRLASTAWQGIN